MYINEDALTYVVATLRLTFRSLAIFDIETHAYMHSKQHMAGLSLYCELFLSSLQLTAALLNTTVTPLGRKLLHTWLLRPLINIPRIKERHDAVEAFCATEQSQLRKLVNKELKGVKNPVKFLHMIKSGRASYRHWKDLVDVSCHDGRVKLTPLRL